MPLGISMLNIRALPSSRAAWLDQTKHLKNTSLMQEASLRGSRQTGLVHITGKSCTLRNPGFLHGSGSWAQAWALHVVVAAWTTRCIPSFPHDVWEFLVGLMACSSAREGLNSAHIPLTPHYGPATPGCLCLFKWSSSRRRMLVRSRR